MAWRLLTLTVLSPTRPPTHPPLPTPTQCGTFGSPSCVMDNKTCATGAAAAAPAAVWYCALSAPPALPNAAGVLCYDLAASCLTGPNAVRGCDEIN